MAETSIRIIFANEAIIDLKNIHSYVLEKTGSKKQAKNVVTAIIDASKKIHFVQQYQIDEFLGEPYRRMIVRHYKIIYRVVNQKEIRILQIFDSYQHPSKQRR